MNLIGGKAFENCKVLVEANLSTTSISILDCKAANDKRPLDYLLSNWTETRTSLLQPALQRWMVDPLVLWGATSWMEDLESLVQAILSEKDKTLCNGAYSVFARCKDMEATSILEMALWKMQIKGGWSNDGTKRQALDREESRIGNCDSECSIVLGNPSSRKGFI